ncbi:MAG: bifunctional diaminohydroxyphosphoribosylaminopyrimidine deaminase/5-amino-6-(5-phosphoribosylamino)uracil reductase RibD [Moraxella sp.]|nr:bifunctional diaminohydroxyphosphoribosylaminopyrimidine deaminase/5-amino-6-(5-phosphoribosylamino)uracil reductase RibD [Moraxella sp.]
MTDILSDDIKSCPTALPDDETFMLMALIEAKKGEFTTRPNPAVGCVIAKNGLIIGKGFHPKVGCSHAEVFALDDVKNNGQDTQGATAYVTLEPCGHFGRTPPCANALMDAGISRVVIATLDPNPKVAGKGVAMLKGAGIDVVVGVCEHQAKDLNKGFLKAMATGLPFVRLKMGISLDGRIAMQNGQSKWITGELSRRDVQNLRAKSGAIITGSGTILADNPALNVRLPDMELDNVGTTAIPQPKIVVVDRSGKLSLDDDFTAFKNPDTLIWRDDLSALLKTLVAEHQCHDVLVEAGATLATGFLNQNLVDELIIYQAPCLLGATARPMFGVDIQHLQDKLNFVLVDVERLGDDVKMIFRPKNLSTA